MTASTLTTAPARDVLERLYADAAEHRPSSRTRAVENPQGWEGGERENFLRAKHIYMEVSRPVGGLLYVLARNGRARSVVEFGTSFGVSTIHLAAGVRDNGGGRVIGTEFEAGKVARARASIAEAGLADVVELREGEATETLGSDLPDSVDLLFLDGAKSMYLDVLALVGPRIRPGGLVVADNAGRNDAYREHVRSCPDYLSVGFEREDVEVSVRLG